MKVVWLNRFLTKTIVALAFALAYLPGAGAETAQSAKNTASIITGKTFPLYNHIADNKAFSGAVKKDAALKSQNLQHIKRVKTAMEQCKDAACYAEAVQWSADEITAIGARLAQLCQDNKKMRRLPAVLRAENRYALYNAHTDSELIRSIWNDAAVGINHILDIYIKGKKPRYPAIDSISFSDSDSGFRDKVLQQLGELAKNNSAKDLFFKLPLQFALQALALNDRDEAARYEPLDQGMNKNAVANIRHIQWDSYPYSLMLVPGQGPEQEGVAIDPMSIRRCRLAAEKYQKRLAPLIVVSGGHVHPNKTPYSEAVEMKKYMVRELNIPEEAILVEPHARHTTTNMRNAARMVYRFGIPESMKILVVTDSVQNSFVGMMEKRFRDELGYLPYRDLKKLSEEESEYFPVPNALQANPLDPLDP